MDDSNNKVSAKTCIIGAGISGLAHAWQLKRNNEECIILEQEAQAGGSISSLRSDKYVAEEGPHSIQLNSAEVEDFLNSIPDLQDSMVEAKPEANNRFIVRDGQLHAVPLKPMALYKSKLWSFKGKLRALKEWFVKPGPADNQESIADFARRRLGDELYNYGINPMVAGIYAGNPEELSLRLTFPKLLAFEQEHGGLLRGIKNAKKDKTKQLGGHTISFRKGMAELTEKLAAALGKALHTSTTIKSISRSDDVWNVTWSDSEDNEHEGSFEELILTIPAHRLSSLPFEPYIRDELRAFIAIEYPPVSVLSLGFKRSDVDHPLDGFGFLVPECENHKILGALFTSSTFPERAYEDEVMIAVFMGGTRQPALAEKDLNTLKATAMADLQKLIGVRGEPTFMHHKYWKKAIPQYTLDYDEKLEQMKQIEMSQPGLKLAGNYRTGISVTACIEAALNYQA